MTMTNIYDCSFTQIGVNAQGLFGSVMLITTCKPILAGGCICIVCIYAYVTLINKYIYNEDLSGNTLNVNINTNTFNDSLDNRPISLMTEG